MEEKKIKFGTIIPLIGGSAIGCARSAGTLPAFHLSYEAFAANESHIERYWKEIPMYRLDAPDIEIPSNTFEDVDYVNSVCPCAGLSLLNSASGSAASRGSDAVQNKWMYESSAYILEHVKPKVLWGENAPGLFTKMGEGVVTRLKQIAETYGYSFSLIKTNTEIHGIPQRRIRTFYFFWNTPTVPMLNWKFREKQSLLDYLNDIPADATLQDMFMVKGKVTDHFRPYEFVLEREGLTHAEFSKKFQRGTISQYIEKNELFDDCVKWLHEKYPKEGFSNKKSTKTFIDMLDHQRAKLADGKGYWDASPHFFHDSFSALIGRNMFNGVHPVKNRYLNVREMLHLMGMPHDFEIQDARQVNHIAQNVPVRTAQDMADEVKKFINGELKMTQYKFMKQDNTTQKVIEGEELHKEVKKIYKVNSII